MGWIIHGRAPRTFLFSGCTKKKKQYCGEESGHPVQAIAGNDVCVGSFAVHRVGFGQWRKQKSERMIAAAALTYNYFM